MKKIMHDKKILMVSQHTVYETLSPYFDHLTIFIKPVWLARDLFHSRHYDCHSNSGSVPFNCQQCFWQDWRGLNLYLTKKSFEMHNSFTRET